MSAESKERKPWPMKWVIVVIIAVLVIANLPSSAAWAIGLLVGIQLLFDGIMMIAAGMAAKKLAESGTV
jgi:uncharacterized membrane protein HdeD (DUF308 family)